MPVCKSALQNRTSSRLTILPNNYLDRIGMSNYEPTEQDILRTHVSICGFNEITFPIGNLNFTIYDIPNVRCGSRRKWNHIFKTATAIMFCVAMSEYDQVLHEDETTNRMQTTLSLFDSICNNRWYTDTPIILFLNKMDLFKEKIKKSPLTLCFPDYKGRGDENSAVDYIMTQFDVKNKSTTKSIYFYKMCALDGWTIKAAFDDIVKNRLYEGFCTY
ncbi:guanine nucleotide-binding protein G(o) subunit alpha isoform X3 [Folsomia candida]|uniref:guanine nucleotide-binding protein G(o) subunit alpha isoform X3 n=1 Tax=Folsomia candida TaxID=158441 RepID=UPI0016054183|nr:guanine nucleotide-binding protein G(o) subunit alpha isoform X3 [Folsomia candida]